ncbi:hypothetical protein BXZ70DRAFT_1075733 [Cristinia sonorae]|uniref:Uncharacterized protein n=1 Tax=Cristinia sonorae TaxID=1940300 RepID=A0A8K0UTE3_9AGAR|nr:hypothetical protein BXZ70DRAFT_1075733 [Cristinia sonorae]
MTTFRKMSQESEQPKIRISPCRQPPSLPTLPTETSAEAKQDSGCMLSVILWVDASSRKNNLRPFISSMKLNGRNGSLAQRLSFRCDDDDGSMSLFPIQLPHHLPNLNFIYIAAAAWKSIAKHPTFYIALSRFSALRTLTITESVEFETCGQYYSFLKHLSLHVTLLILENVRFPPRDGRVAGRASKISTPALRISMTRLGNLVKTLSMTAAPLNEADPDMISVFTFINKCKPSLEALRLKVATFDSSTLGYLDLTSHFRLRLLEISPVLVGPMASICAFCHGVLSSVSFSGVHDLIIHIRVVPVPIQRPRIPPWESDITWSSVDSVLVSPTFAQIKSIVFGISIMGPRKTDSLRYTALSSATLAQLVPQFLKQTNARLEKIDPDSDIVEHDQTMKEFWELRGIQKPEA